MQCLWLQLSKRLSDLMVKYETCSTSLQIKLSCQFGWEILSLKVLNCRWYIQRQPHWWLMLESPWRVFISYWPFNTLQSYTGCPQDKQGNIADGLATVSPEWDLYC